ncbi:hypothetical protein [Mangrovibacter plantisponsor]|uniref:Inner membrane protein n=1 Tax=Mangrovibacter plantisponsor TaxID=451513 RepID=A0A317PWL5_9ENTR|nr:hypothetical protein [Mangrovibacter plantisponsor]PWW04666.1 hypothetical protein DES37_11555 [Mangrovibacter plantisponsor]
MNKFLENKWSYAGMLLGACALILSIFHFTAGPFTSPAQSLERTVAEKVSAVKSGIIAGLKGQEPPAPAKKHWPNIDTVLTNASIGLAAVALLCAFIGGLCKESSWCVNGALFFGSSTLVFYAFLVWAALVCTLLILFIIVSFFTGPPC